MPLPPRWRERHDGDVTIANHSGARRAVGMTRALLALILVVCAAAAALAWVMESPTVFALALVIAAEETWEISVVLGALRRERRAVRAPLAPLRAATPLPWHRS
jgi:hypothetical protein